MALLEVHDVTRTFAAGQTAVAGVSLSLEEGEILCLLGPSGCGKTTLLRIIAGLESADTGRVVFAGRDLAGVRPHERQFGMMFQDFALFPHKNVAGNVAFGLRMQGRPPDEIAARVAEELALVDLADFGDREIGRLSGGEQQRVALARALAPRPQLLMLDEPLGALDRALRERLMLEVRAILKQVGMTAIYVTHDQTEAFAVADRVAVMNAGRLEQVARPEVIYDDPATPFVARFLGFRNLLPGVAAAAGEVVTAVGRFRPDGAATAPGAAGTLLVRPVAGVCGVAGEEPPGVNEIEGVVTSLVFRGRFSQVGLRAGDGVALVFEMMAVAGGSSRPPFGPGDRVRLCVPPGGLRWWGERQDDAG